MARRWWRKRALRIYHPHMSVHEMVSLDVPAFVAACVETNAEAIVVNAAGLYAYYPTKVPCHHVPEALGDRDLLGEIVAGLRGQGLRVIARCDFSRVRREDAEAHPEWMIDDDPYGTYLPVCISSPYSAEAFAMPVVREVMGQYAPDGLMLEGLGFISPAGCPACQSAFGEIPDGFGINSEWEKAGDGLTAEERAILGDTPTIPGSTVEERMAWLTWRHKTLAERVRSLHQVAIRIDPSVLCLGRDAGPFWRAMSRSSSEFLVQLGHSQSVPGMYAEWNEGRGGDVSRAGLGAEMSRGARRKRRPLMIVTQMVRGNPNDHVLPPRAELERVAYQSLAHGASLMFETTGGPTASSNGRMMSTIASAFSLMRAQSDVLDLGSRPIRGVAVIWPSATLTRARAHEDEGLDGQSRSTAEGMWFALQARHMQCGIIHDSRLTAKALRRGEAVLVPTIEMLDEASLALLLDYAKVGGRVLICDGAPEYPKGALPVLDSLAEALGCEISNDTATVERALPDASDMCPIREPIGPLKLSRPSHRVIVDSGDTVVWMRKAPGSPLYESWEDSVPRPGGDEPLMLSQAVGEGMVTYCSWPLGYGLGIWWHNDASSLIAQAMRYGAELPPRLQVDAPACIEVTMAHWRDGIVIHLVNHAGALMGDVTPVGPISLDLAWDGPAQVVLAAPGQPDQALPAVEQWNRVTITVPRVEVYAQVVVRTG